MGSLGQRLLNQKEWDGLRDRDFNGAGTELSVGKSVFSWGRWSLKKLWGEAKSRQLGRIRSSDSRRFCHRAGLGSVPLMAR